MKRFLLALLGLGLLAGPLVANAIPVNIDITPSPGATWVMTGSFDIDPGGATYSDFTVNLTWAAGPGFNDTPCDGCEPGGVNSSGSTIGLIDPTLAQTSFLQDYTVTFGGGVLDAIFRGNSISLESSSGRFDGTYMFQAIPEPPTLVLFVLGLLGMGLLRRRLV